MEDKEDNDFNDDEEVFFGRLTLKEVRKRIFMNVPQKRLPRCDENDIKIIETSSEPNMLSTINSEDGVENLKSTSDPVFNRNKQHPKIKIPANSICESRDSFLELEGKVTECCKSPCSSNDNLDNTLEFVDFILHHGQHLIRKNPDLDIQKSGDNDKNFKDAKAPDRSQYLEKINQDLNILGNSNGDKCFQDVEVIKDEKICELNPVNDRETYKENDDIAKSTYTPTPIKYEQNEPFSVTSKMESEVANILDTPVGNKINMANLFKTPKNPLSSKKVTSVKKTPIRSKSKYEHIASPIATYIKNCPQAPLVKDVHPKKPLPSTSLIPKPLNNASKIKNNKENIVLPQLAYRNAKKTVVINVNKEKLPKSNWAQKLTSVPGTPVVLKHNYREGSKLPLSLQHQHEDSFQDLSLHQAEVSICTEKLAFQKL